MVFSSLMFLFAFLPCVLAVYFIVPRRFRTARNCVLLVFSLVFYAYGEPKGIVVMLASIAANYLLALALDRFHRGRRALLIAAVIFNIGLLCAYKYTGFAVENVNSLFGLSIAVPKIVMPIGISFFTFQGLSYCIDVYRRTCPAQRSIIKVGTYIALFPQLIAGPIVRYQTIADELSCRTETLSGFADGARRFLIGLGKKMLLANTLGALASKAFDADPSVLSCGLAWLGAAAYSFQILFDFSGYSDMAIGLGKIFGFTFPENFNYPYISRSITEFWSRWHISLGSWFRDYVYIPLGGNRRGLPRQLLNILVVWLLTGLWHGASWNFVIWGLYFALLLALEKLFLGKLLKKVWRPISHAYALLFILFGWVIFNGGSVSHIISYFAAMFGLASAPNAVSGYALMMLKGYKLEFIAAVICSLPLAKLISGRLKGPRLGEAVGIAADVGLFAVFALSVIAIVNSSFNPFIYFRF